MQRFRIIAFTHKTTDINDIGKLHIEDADLQQRLQSLKAALQLEELMYLSTCNRVEFILSAGAPADAAFLQQFFSAFDPSWTAGELGWALQNAQVFEGDAALNHLFSVASSIDSLVVGEREIITQVRNAYEKCNALGLTGDLIRLAIKSTIEVVGRRLGREGPGMVPKVDGAALALPALSKPATDGKPRSTRRNAKMKTKLRPIRG